MKRGSTLRNLILELRRKKKSYREIADALGIYKSRISYLVGNNPESVATKKLLTARNIKKSRVRIRAVNKVSQEKWGRWRAEARREARQEFARFSANPLFVAGIMIYWGEGDSKQKNPLRISNTDPRMIALYAGFLRTIMGLPDEKIRLGLILYPDLDDASCKRFWSRVANLPKENFMKSQYIKGHHPTKRLSRGICMVVVSSRQKKIKVLEWIDLFQRRYTIKENLRV